MKHHLSLLFRHHRRRAITSFSSIIMLSVFVCISKPRLSSGFVVRCSSITRSHASTTRTVPKSTEYQKTTNPTFTLRKIGILQRQITTDSSPSLSVTNPRQSSNSALQSKNDVSDIADSNRLLHLSTASLEELKTIVSSWGYPAFRGQQIYHWIREQGVTDPASMKNLPLQLRQQLQAYSQTGSLKQLVEQVSKDGTIKRLYQCQDGQYIESVLMSYRDNRYTACISSQAGCAQGCVFCATGQMGFSRQLSEDEIFEQVARFATELRRDQQKRLSNIVFMGMGEPLANYRNVKAAVERIQSELGIGARRITISTVGIVPIIKKLAHDLPQVRLAVSLHCATDTERTALLPANARNGGLDSLFAALRQHVEITKKRITLEWALIAGENDHPDAAQQLGELVIMHGLRRDMVHVNVIPLNPTGQYVGRPSQRTAVQQFCSVLEKEYGIACTPRVRRGIDIDAGCGQLTVTRQEQDKKSKSTVGEYSPSSVPPVVGVYDDDDDDNYDVDKDHELESTGEREAKVDWNKFDEPDFQDETDQKEAMRLLSLVKGTTINLAKLENVDEKGPAEPATTTDN